MNTSAALQELPGTESEPQKESVAPAWGLAKRILFRFTFAYLVLYNLPFPLSAFPWAQKLNEAYEAGWKAFVPWVGKQLFGLDITVFPRGSGDTTFNYVQLFCMLVMAAVVTLVWSLLDRKRPGYERLHEWLRVYVRFSLGASMISYGAFKLIPSQFSTPSLGTLFQTYGEASPMGILWTFMGASLAYTMFTGAAEMLGGLLLVARRTTLLGALVCIGVMGNVVMLNLSYDVPVKLYSSHLLAMAVFLTLPGLRRLADVLVLNRESEPVRMRPLFERELLNRGALAIRTVFVATLVAQMLYVSYDGAREYGHLAPKVPFHGIWNVEEFEMDGQIRPALITDKARWQRLIFEWEDFVVVHPMDDSQGQFYLLKLEAGARKLVLTKFKDPKWKSELSFRKPSPGLLELQGMYDGKRVRALLRRVDEANFPLFGRGFHWINEYPYNR